MISRRLLDLIHCCHHIEVWRIIYFIKLFLYFRLWCSTQHGYYGGISNILRYALCIGNRLFLDMQNMMTVVIFPYIYPLSPSNQSAIIFQVIDSNLCHCHSILVNYPTQGRSWIELIFQFFPQRYALFFDTPFYAMDYLLSILAHANWRSFNAIW